MQGLQLAPLGEQHYSGLESLRVHPEQRKFVGTLNEILCNVSPSVRPNVVLFDNQLVGFFLIDSAYSARYEFCQGAALGLRAFFIDQQRQGQGLGKAAMAALAPFIKQHYPHADQLYLTVNCQNPAAYACYIGAGFCDTDTLYHGGAAGPQHILRLAL